MSATLPPNVHYTPRVADTVLERRLRSAPTVLIEGVRACGKTTTARQHAASEVLLERSIASVSLASLGALKVLEGSAPRLIDEWQLAPDIWDMVRRECDRRSSPGQFILTGSADPPPSATQHSGTGRVARVRMRPMSLFESGSSTGEVSLQGLFDGAECSAPMSDIELGDIADAICSGGWPFCQHMDTADAQDFIIDYLEGLATVELGVVEGPRRNPAAISRTLASLARNISTEATLSTLAADIGSGGPVDPRTAATYAAVLERLFVSEDVPAWSPRLRSRSRLRGAPKRQLADPSQHSAHSGALLGSH